ncbi:sulfite exporter TauE/SafE family protein [Gephyromycinifex aptenodytis]|uniref:sulfite exporter TauE/SafE family protein n=1 Tax=Gephyromycinifex aptenodytis TaxID=2716227 RepID=UPI00144718B2|nr:sulfite exporter TauE/SafE family protein [Gephyromycinifex aptenodytis]
MPLWELIIVLLAGVAAGTINTIVGSGSLITFPTLLFFGYPPVVANMSNNVGLLPRGLTGVHGYRRELAGQGRVLRRLLPASALGGITGALLLLVLPPQVFEVVVPLLIGIGVALVAFGPALQKRAAAAHDDVVHPARAAALPVGIFLAGVYGGYFGAAQGVILVGIMSVLMAQDLQVVNGIKNVLGLCVNTIAALVFITVAGRDIDWLVAAVIGVGTLIGGVIGARVGRRLPRPILRAIIVLIGVTAIIRMTLFA